MDGGDLWGPFLKHDLYADGRLTCSAQEGYALSTHRNPFENRHLFTQHIPWYVPTFIQYSNLPENITKYF